MLLMSMSLRRLRLFFYCLVLEQHLPTVLCYNWEEFEKNSISVYLQDFYRRLATAAYQTLRNFVSEGYLIKYTLNFEFRQMHFYLP